MMKKETGMIKKFVLTAAIGAFSLMMLTACGAKEPDGYYTLESVIEDGEEVDEDDFDDDGFDNSYAVFEDGKGYLVLLNTPEDVKYNAEKGTLSSDFGKFAASLKGKKLTIADGKTIMVFTKSKEDAPKKPGYPVIAAADDLPDAGVDEPWDSGAGATEAMPDYYDILDRLREEQPDIDWDNFDWESYDWAKDPYDLTEYFTQEYQNYTESETATEPAAEPAAGADPLLDFWNDYWFGWIKIEGMTDEWRKYDDEKFPVLGRSALNEDGSGYIYLWDNESMVAEVQCSNNGYGLSEAGTMVSESGQIFSKPAAHADWSVDPGIYDLDNYVRIDGRFYDDNDDLQFFYEVHLVRWGESWDHLDAELLPAEKYYEWYQEQIDKGVTTPTFLPEE
ncbi:MAG: hypothetical protein K6F53_02990 [Lachnospiraceae bacterium]|nr:hypothetical protein [Lachnospiraceae bacterium]